ncbi:Protein CBG26453 [Caenorhabditis briggsae]|uniref:Protein CBG26453 n=1 Tax=Caenorhabditis briggsae TaxID=6238 RepID=B6IKP0_CAEBR|nr:Protein CBG26453 [Caenorhabditis briggsae]CAS00470.1 Protein CBG26453 [Caenorhabditis briggsae]
MERCVEVRSLSSADWNNGELGGNNSSTDGGGDFLGALDSESNVTVVVSDGNESLEAGTLTGTGSLIVQICKLIKDLRGLLLDWRDLEDFVLKVGAKSIDDLELLDWKRVEVDLLEGGDLLLLDESSELGHWSPFGFLLSSTSGSRISNLTSS